MQSFEVDKKDLTRVKAALEGDDAVLSEILKDYHASEIAILFEKLSSDAQERIINLLPTEIA